MRIGLITDTHIPVAAAELPGQVAKIFKGVDLILHAGDIYRASVLDELEKIAPVKAALGDDDPFNLTEDERVAMKHVLNVEGYTLWLVHERPYMFHLTAQQVAEAPDIVVHGHSHEARVQEYNGVLFIGSGSPTFLNYTRGPGTVGILEISPGDARASIVHL
jgi:putative phosphoesterase